MKNIKENNIQKSLHDYDEDFFVATECICDDEGVHYICPTCGKYHLTDLDALMCCIE